MQQQIQQDFIQAMKAKDEIGKAALSSLKTELKREQIQKKRELTEAECIRVVAKQVKQREESQKQFIAGNRPELAQKEEAEADFLRKYLPSQMSEDDIRSNLKTIMEGLSMPNAKALAGKTMGEFNKNFPGAADMAVVKRVVDELAEQCV